MPRQKKDTKILNIKLATPVNDQLEAFCEETGMSKTIATGKILREIKTVRKNFPLGIVYWSQTGENTYEYLDGQQRSISICQYVNKDYPIRTDENDKFFHNLTLEQQEDVLGLFDLTDEQSEKIISLVSTMYWINSRV